MNKIGSILLNGKPGDPKTWYREYSYVIQRDVHFSLLTVEETVYFSAALQMPPVFTEEEIRQRVDVVLQLLGLTHVKKSIVGDNLRRGISGGEKRRLSIGVEWVKGSIFFTKS